MTLGGRPTEDDGHRRKNLSLDMSTHMILNMQDNASVFAEHAIKEHFSRRELEKSSL
jgi:hypothetical protein